MLSTTQARLVSSKSSEWLAELFKAAGYELHLAHPLRTRAIAAARLKTDAIDARCSLTCCALGCCRRLPRAARTRHLRELLRQRATLTTMRSAKDACINASRRLKSTIARSVWSNRAITGLDPNGSPPLAAPFLPR